MCFDIFLILVPDNFQTPGKCFNYFFKSLNNSSKMARLETIPNEIFLQITKNLSGKEIKTCRLVSLLMREKVDRLFNTHLCVVNFNEKSERAFVAKRKLQLGIPIHFTRMRIESVSYFLSSKNNNKKMLNLRKEYFQNITELEITEFVPKNYFHQIIKLTGSLRILKLSSAVLGGTENLFGKDTDISAQTRLANPKPMLFLRRALPQPLIKNILDAHRPSTLFHQRSINKWSALQELHIKLDYICPGSVINPSFSPLWLVENLRSIQNLPVPSLQIFKLTVEKDKDGDMFYFTVNSLLNFIPVMSYPSLKKVNVGAPKCRPISQKESEENCQQQQQKRKDIFSLMQLDDLKVNISEGVENHAIPNNLMYILQTQRSLKTVSIQGIRNAHVLMLANYSFN